MKVEIGEEWVQLFPEPNLAIGLAMNRALRRFGSDAEALQLALAQVYLRWGIEAWSFADPVDPNDPEFLVTVERNLPYTKGGETVVRAADGLYGKVMVDYFLGGRPSATEPFRSSPAGPTDASTSPTPTSSTSLQRQYARFLQPASAGGTPSSA